MSQLRFSPVNIHLYVSSACDLACSYCWNQGGTFGGVYRGLMDQETASATINFVKKLLQTQSSPTLSFSLFGGEPLLNPTILKYLIEKLLLLRETAVDLRLLLFSNGCIFDAALAELIRAHPNVEYHVGLDGRREIHDRHRIDRQGRGSFDKIVQTIHALRAHGVFVAAESVVLPPYDYHGLLKTYEELGLGFAYIQDEILPKHGKKPDQDLMPLENLKEWAESYRDFTDLYFASLCNGTAPLIDPLFGIVKWFLPVQEFSGLACTVGTSQIAISSNGDIYACNQLLNVARFRLGSVFSGVEPEAYRAFSDFLAAHGRIVDRNPACQRCSIAPYCKGGCYARNLIASGHIETIESESMCEFRRVRAAINWSFVKRMLAKFPTYTEDVQQRNYLRYFPQLFRGGHQ